MKFKFILGLLGITSLFADQGKVVKVNEKVEIWYEAFGQKEDPACLLIMGAGGPGVLWSRSFCEKLAAKGFYVVRYDQRDTGYSTYVDFAKNPYTLLDMAQDSLDLLNILQIEKAHLVGLSMGGPIAELMSIREPKRVQSLALLVTSSDFRPLNLVVAGLPPEEGLLSSPADSYQQAIIPILKDSSSETKEEKQAHWMAIWNVMRGSITLEDEDKIKEGKEHASRPQNPSALKNHLCAIMASEELIRSVPAQVTVPTVILSGAEDPIFGPDHGADLAKKIRNSKYYLIPQMGHVIHSYFNDLLIEKIEQNTKETQKQP